MGTAIKVFLIRLFFLTIICCIPRITLGEPPLSPPGDSQCETPSPGQPFLELILKTPVNKEHLDYLGLSKTKDDFTLSQIKASVLIIEIFSMYCPHCQREAPTLNDLYAQIESSEALKGRVKIIGIGVGNSPFEVGFFQKKYNIPFPLFSDEDFAIHKQLGEVRTPYFFGIHLHTVKDPTVFFSKLGGAKDAKALLDELMKAAMLQSDF